MQKSKTHRAQFEVEGNGSVRTGRCSARGAGNKPPEEKRSAYDGDTAFKLYLREIGQVKLLTPQEEIELAAKIKKGDKKAREQMIKANCDWWSRLLMIMKGSACLCWI
jgi:DNA-directed RNA polymerase sigma subunit (sigma70/sigma32)